jgi:uncharacterized protein YndB with AHSA1/START domain
MNPTPSGRLVRTPEGRDLVLIRTFRAPIEDVWASITESERTARWFGSWSWAGEAGPGNRIRYTTAFEPEGEPSEMTILACEPPRHLAVRGTGDYAWHLEAELTESDGVTELRFTHHLDDQVNVGEVGPGWEYYLDNLVASRDGAPPPDFNDYYPSQAEYYRERQEEISGS